VGGVNEFMDLIPEFLEEARDHLTTIEADLVQVETALKEQRIPDGDLLSRLFRAAHAIRGGAEFVGLESIERVAGALADLFNLLRNGDIAPDAELVALAFRAVDRIKAVAADPGASGQNAEGTVSLLRKAVAERLPDRVRQSTETVVSPEGPGDGVRFSVSAYTLERKRRRGTLYVVSVPPEHHAAETGQSIMDLSEELGALGEVLDTATVTDPDGGAIVHFLYHTTLAPDALRLSFPAIPSEAIVPVPRERLDTLVSSEGEGTSGERRRSPAPTAGTGDAPHAEDRPATGTDAWDDPHGAAFGPKQTAGTLEDIISDTAWDRCSEFVSFFLDRELYAVPIFLVHDIKEMLPCSRLPNQPCAVLGVVNLRGNVVPVFDLRRIIGLPPRPFDSKTVMLILDIGGKMNGIVVDAISDVATLDPQAKQMTPLLGRDLASEHVRFIGTDKKNGAFLIVLDIEKALAKVFDAS